MNLSEEGFWILDLAWFLPICIIACDVCPAPLHIQISNLKALFRYLDECHRSVWATGGRRWLVVKNQPEMHFHIFPHWKQKKFHWTMSLLPKCKDSRFFAIINSLCDFLGGHQQLYKWPWHRLVDWRPTQKKKKVFWDNTVTWSTPTEVILKDIQQAGYIKTCP